MAEKNREIEAKFYLTELHTLRDRLLSAGGQIAVERTFERNWRFDTPDRRFERTGEVLRVRKDRSSTLTYKRPTEIPEDRVEIELQVDEPEQASQFLEALGFQVVTIYEKYRETFSIEGTLVTLDELPFGNFAELEGESLDQIMTVAESLGLKWEHRVRWNYVEIFTRLVERRSLALSHATFESFAQSDPVTAEDLGLHPALD